MSLARTIIDNCTGIGDNGIEVFDAQSVELTNSTAIGNFNGIVIGTNVTDCIFTDLTVKNLEAAGVGASISSGQNVFDSITITSSGLGLVINDSTTIVNFNVYAFSSAEGISILQDSVNLINTSVYSDSGHAIKLNKSNNCSIINCQMKVGISSQNCINSDSAVTTFYTKNSLLGATVPINANVTQGIVATEDGQGNIIL